MLDNLRMFAKDLDLLNIVAIDELDDDLAGSISSQTAYAIACHSLA